jgi:hypothetical protein
MLGGLFVMFSVGAGLLAREEYGKTIGWLTFIFSVVVSSLLYRLTILFDDNKIPDRTIRKWHKRIVADAETKLGRPLTSTERQLITSRRGCIALEMIHDNVRAGTKEEIISYLNSESGQSSNHGLNPTVAPRGRGTTSG